MFSKMLSSLLFDFTFLFPRSDKTFHPWSHLLNANSYARNPLIFQHQRNVGASVDYTVHAAVFHPVTGTQ